MADQIEASEANAKTESELLRERATQMGITFHPNIGDTALKKKINDHLESDKPVEEAPKEKEEDTSNMTRGQIMAMHRRKASALVRVIVAPNNPLKNAIPGEIITVSNRVIGTISCFIPFNNEEGWYLPQAIINVLKERKYQTHVKKKVNGEEFTVPKLVREFNINVLPSHNEEELAELAKTQRETGSLREE